MYPLSCSKFIYFVAAMYMQPYTFLVAAASVDNSRERAGNNAWTTPQIYRSCSATWVASWILNYILLGHLGRELDIKLHTRTLVKLLGPGGGELHTMATTPPTWG
jgi:hypothetical protein